MYLTVCPYYGNGVPGNIQPNMDWSWNNGLKQAVDRGKKVVIAEIGWPSADDGERTTVDNEKTNFDTTKAFLLGPGNFALDAYWFEAFDEWWKPAEGNPPKPLGPHWGMFTGGDSFGEPKWKPVPTGR